MSRIITDTARVKAESVQLSGLGFARKGARHDESFVGLVVRQYVSPSVQSLVSPHVRNLRLSVCADTRNAARLPSNQQPLSRAAAPCVARRRAAPARPLVPQLLERGGVPAPPRRGRPAASPARVAPLRRAPREPARSAAARARSRAVGGGDDPEVGPGGGAVEGAAQRDSQRHRPHTPPSQLFTSKEDAAGDAASAAAPKADKMGAAKDLLARYGSAYLVTSISLSVVSFSLCYALVSSGVDVGALLARLGLPVSATGEQAGVVAIAYAVHKAASPIRFPPTVVLTPIVARWMGKSIK